MRREEVAHLPLGAKSSNHAVKVNRAKQQEKTCRKNNLYAGLVGRNLDSHRKSNVGQKCPNVVAPPIYSEVSNPNFLEKLRG